MGGAASVRDRNAEHMVYNKMTCCILGGVGTGLSPVSLEMIIRHVSTNTTRITLPLLYIIPTGEHVEPLVESFDAPEWHQWITK
jgi:hypothetical protein